MNKVMSDAAENTIERMKNEEKVNVAELIWKNRSEVDEEEMMETDSSESIAYLTSEDLELLSKKKLSVKKKTKLQSCMQSFLSINIFLR